RHPEELEEVAAPERIGTELPLEPPQRILVLEQGDHDAFCRRMLALREPGVSAARRRLDRRDVPPENLEPFRLPALLESESRESEEHGGPTAPGSQRPCGDRQVYVRPSAWRAQCSAGRTSARSPRSARSAAPTKSSSSSTSRETIRSSITSARSAISAATRVCPSGT